MRTLLIKTTHRLPTMEHKSMFFRKEKNNGGINDTPCGFDLRKNSKRELAIESNKSACVCTHLTLSCLCMASFFSICSMGNCGTSYGADSSFGSSRPSPPAAMGYGVVGLSLPAIKIHHSQIESLSVIQTDPICWV